MVSCVLGATDVGEHGMIWVTENRCTVDGGGGLITDTDCPEAEGTKKGSKVPTED